MKRKMSLSSMAGLIGIICLVFVFWVSPIESQAIGIEKSPVQFVKQVPESGMPTLNKSFADGLSNSTISTHNPCDLSQQNAPSSTNPIYFNHLYSINSENSASGGVIPITDGYFVLSGHGDSGGVTKFDQHGMPVFSKDFSYSYDVDLFDVTKTSDGKYLAGGFYINTYAEGILAKVDSDLTPLWVKTSNTLNYDTFIAAVESTVDNGILALARENRGFGILKFDGSGNLLWKKRIYVAPDLFTDAFSIRENYYYDASLNKHCGGIIIFGAVYHNANNPDLYLAAISCDGSTIHWQRIIGGSSWDGTYNDSGMMYERSSNMIMMEDHNSENTQNAKYAVAATTNSFGQNEAIMVIPFTITGTTTLSSTVSVGQIKLVDGSNQEIVHASGTRFMRLSDGNALLVGKTDSSGAGSMDIYLIKMDTSFSPIWQYTYGTAGYELGYGISETTNGIQLAGLSQTAAVFSSLESNGTNQDLCLERNTANLTVSNLSPTITTPTYTVDNGTLAISSDTLTLTDSDASITCPRLVYLPLTLK